MMTLTPNDYQRGFNDGVAAATTPDPRVIKLVEAAREAVEYFESRADAEYFTDSPAPVGNEEMTHFTELSAALSAFNGDGK